MESQQLRWIGTPAPRAPPIPPQKWVEHKEELRRLYLDQDRFLEDVMAMMKFSHNFTPSKRQYVVQFGKWQFRKNQSSEISQASSTPAPLADAPPPPPHDTIQSTHASTAKRQHSLQSIRSSQMSQGSRGRPPVPPKKRHLSEAMRARDPYADLDMAFGNSHSPFEVQDDPVEVPSASANTVALSVRCIGGRTPTPSLWADSNSWVSVDESSEGDMLLPCSTRSEASAWEDNDHSVWSTPRASTEHIPLRERRIDSSRPIETFTQDELHDMKIAADCLMSLTFDKESFSLNALLIKRIRQFKHRPRAVVISSLISCARTCYSSSQVEIAQNLLRQALDESKGPIHEADNFVFRMLLADSYTRGRNYDEAIPHIKQAWRSVRRHKNFLDTLPKEHRVFDLMLYHYLTRSVRHHQLLEEDDTVDGDDEDDLENPFVGEPVLSETELQDHFLAKVPGPFELSDGVLHNPCIRSCISWCIKIIEGTGSEPRPWKTLIKKCEQHRWAAGTGLQLLVAMRMTDKQISIALLIALELFLWQRWQALRWDPAEQESLLWANEAENLMGISPSELLGTVACMIIRESHHNKPKRSQGLLARARFGISKLKKYTDRKIGINFLTVFSKTAHLGPSVSEQAGCNLTILSWKGMFDLWNADMAAVRQVAALYAKEFVEETLMMSLPEVHNSPVAAVEAQAGPLIICATIFPALASSYKSSELSAFRSLRDRIPEVVQRAVQGATAALPSDFLADARRHSASLMSMDELSQLMASSTLSLLPVRQASSSARNSLVNASDNVIYRLNDMRRAAGTGIQRLMDDSDDEDDAPMGVW